MFIHLIGVNEKILNLANIVLLEDQSTKTHAQVVVTTATGLELEFSGDDAEIILKRAELIISATDAALLQAQQLANQQP